MLFTLAIAEAQLSVSQGVKLKEEFPSIAAYLDAQRLLRAEVMESMNKVELAMKGQYDNGRDSWGDTRSRLETRSG